ncbi:flagellar export chaperone FliS [Bowmanella pacifica]|uniref:Flagellar secretion chaperone FliS n=1 Tax=Bowmanella pacifica TaxID=502051 RepID=A0A917YXW6_9ALTE|nr:flagellar export chaperone FliS [Bowmanella pacifica]GGO69343.1 flagellar protein FliS [Bowmanella pacifica]
MLDSGFQAYRSTAVEGRAAGADIHKLVLMLFDGFLEELERVAGHIQAKRFDKKAQGIERLLRILGGLDASLDHDNGGEIAKNMKSLYGHCGQALLQASLKNDVQQLDSVKAVMTDLQQGWLGLGSQAA